MKSEFFTLLLIIQLIWNTRCQINTGSSVAPLLIECYNNSAIPGITIADFRPPSTINLLIEYIRMLEDANPTISAQTLSVQLIQRLRQDGILYSGQQVDESYGVPYSATRLETYKLRILLTKFLPNVQQDLDFGDLHRAEKCALHYMISNTIDETKRSNEASECTKSARYTSRIRSKRNTGDSELVNLSGLGVLSANNENDVSQCPIELGVAYSQFGTIKSGNVLAGITTGLNAETFENVDNRYAGTLIGELCEAALYQAPTIPTKLGSSGGWNSTTNPKYFFLQNNNYLQATDSELRGAVDGLIMAIKMNDWITTFPDIKISQILDMYYSPFEKGVLNKTITACNRNALYSELISDDTIKIQSTNFIDILNKEAQISGNSWLNSTLATFADAGVTAFKSYFPSMISSDLSCKEAETIQRGLADLRIFIDFNWSLSTIKPLLSYILNNIDVNKFGTHYTIYGGNSLNKIINETHYLSKFHITFNDSVYSNETSGIDYAKIFDTVETIAKEKLDNNTYTGGESTIILIVTKSKLTDAQSDSILNKRRGIVQKYPFINILVIGNGQQSDYGALVTNPTNEIEILDETTNDETLKTAGNDVIKNILNVPRDLINPSCSSNYNSGETNAFSLTQYVEPRGQNYYRIGVNYFYHGSDAITLRIREQGYGTITICTSKDNNTIDYQNTNCRIITNTEFTEELNKCDGSSIDVCAPSYFIVYGGNSTAKCKDTLCRFPNDIKYTITLENAICADSGGSISQPASRTIIIGLFLFIIWRINII